VLGEPSAAHGLAGTGAAIRPRPDIGLATVTADGIQKIDADDLHHVVHENSFMEPCELAFETLHDFPPAPVVRR